VVEQGLELGQQEDLGGSRGLGAYSQKLNLAWRIAFVALPILGLMYVVARNNYLLFHATAEGFAIIVAGVIYVLTTRTYKYSNKTYLLFLGNAYLFIATLDFLHYLTYKGMGVFPAYGTNIPTQLWIAGRYLDSLTLLLAPFFIGRRSFPQRRVFGAYLAVTGALIASIMWLQVFPTCYIDGQGLTPFKVGSEYVVCLLLLAAIFHLRHHRRQIEPFTYRLLVAAMVATIFAELSFTLYTDVHGIMNFAGHAFKIMAYYFVYRGIVIQGLEAPYMEIRRLNENLENRVRERTAELEVANKELEAFAYSVSHDLRAPLRHIDGFSKILLEAHTDKLDEEGQRYLQFLRNGSQKMGQLLDALLALSRVTRAEMRRQPVDLSALASAVLADLRKEQPERQVELTIEPGVGAEGDPQLLRVALDNLLGNAWKFTSKRTVAKIQFGATRQRDQLVCFVKDNGAGFDMAYADKLFGAFQRLHSGEEFPGTGIGLATVQRIVRRHGGRVWAEGAVDQGATFYFTLGHS